MIYINAIITITRKLHPPEINRSLSICKDIKMPREDIRLQFPVRTCIDRDTKQKCNLVSCSQSVPYPFRCERMHLRATATTLCPRSLVKVPVKAGQGVYCRSRGLTRVRALEITAHILPLSLKALYHTTWVMMVMWAESRYYISSLYVGSWKLSDSRQLPWLLGLNRFPDQAESCKENEIQ